MITYIQDCKKTILENASVYIGVLKKSEIEIIFYYMMNHNIDLDDINEIHPTWISFILSKAIEYKKFESKYLWKISFYKSSYIFVLRIIDLYVNETTFEYYYDFIIRLQNVLCVYSKHQRLQHIICHYFYNQCTVCTYCWFFKT